MKPSKGSKRVALNGERIGCSFCAHEVDHRALGHDLRAEREKMGMSQAEVARAMGTSATYVCDLEQGKRNWTASTVNKYLAAVRGTKP
jgi:predicted transcriptional regulator